MGSLSDFTYIHSILRIFFHKRTAIRRALSCRGWTSKQKLSLLYDMAQQTKNLDGDILEIGSAWGRSAVLLGFASSKRIWSIDPHTGGRAYIERGELQNSFGTFRGNLARFGLEDRVISLQFTTGDVIAKDMLPPSLKLSMAFIDGLHTAKGVEVDFELALSRLVSCGVIVFDDYGETSIPDYTEMIDILLERNNLNLKRDNKSGLVYVKK